MIDDKKVARLIEVTDQIGELEKVEKKLKDEVKSEMLADKVFTVKSGTRVITITQSSRTTTKDEDLVKFLASKGLKTCLKMTILPDMDQVKEAIKSGLLTQVEIDAFSTTIPVNTMKIK